MGCGASSQSSMVAKSSKANPKKGKSQQKPSKSGQNPDSMGSDLEIACAELNDAIRKDDAWLVTSAFTKHNIEVNQSIGEIGHDDTPLHIAAQNNSPAAIDCIISIINLKDPNGIGFYFSIADCDGNTPAMVACWWDSPESLTVFLEYSDLIQLDRKNNEGLDIFGIAQSSSATCLNILNQTFQKEYQLSESLKNDMSAKELELNLLFENMEGKSKQNEKSQSQKLQGDAQKLQAELSRGNRGAEEIINARKLQKEQVSNPNANGTLRYTSILEQLEGQNAFEDLDFPPNIESLCVDKSHQMYSKTFLKAKWRRPHEFLKVEDNSNIKLFDGISPNDIGQGCLGVCYFLCSLAAIAEFPSRLQKIFNTKESNPNGVYSVTLHNRGVPQEIIVDDKFPCYESGMPMFSSPKGNEIWTMVLEKAWAKLYGNFVVTEAGFETVALSSLLGAPSDLKMLNENTDPKKVWEDISSWDREKYIMTCSTKEITDEKKTGLVQGHAYSLLGAYEVGKYRLLKIRNPWGSGEWKGDFSDKSPLWTDEAKRIVGYTDADDGIFCMTLADFVTQWGNYSVCYHKENYFRTHQEIESHKRHPEYFEFELKEKSMTSISVIQKDDRFFAKSEKYEYSPVEIILLKKNGDSYKHICSNSGVWGEIAYGLNAGNNDYRLLEAGFYVLRVKILWKQGEKGSFGLVSNSEKLMTLTKVNREKYADFLKWYVNDAILGVKSPKLDDIGNDCKFGSNWLEAPMFGMIVQNNGTGTLELKITLKGENKLRVPKKFKVSNQKVLIFKVPSNVTAVQYLKQMDITDGGNLEWDFEQTYA